LAENAEHGRLVAPKSARPAGRPPLCTDGWRSSHGRLADLQPDKCPTRRTSPRTNSPSGGTFLVWTRLFRPLGAGGAPLFRRRRAAPRGARLFCPRSGFFHPKVRFLQLFAGERGGDKRLHGKLRPATFRSEQRPQFKLYTQCANIAQPDS
jgi:hypothetical protein